MKINLNDIKSIVKNGVNICRLNDYIYDKYNHDKNVKIVADSALFTPILPWYTIVLSLYSSINLIQEYMKERQDSFKISIDYSTFGIEKCCEHDGCNNLENTPPDLNTILKRMRNSIAHGSFEKSNTSPCIISFSDCNKYKNCIPTKKHFLIQFKGLDLLKFLENVEKLFCDKYEKEA